MQKDMHTPSISARNREQPAVFVGASAGRLTGYQRAAREMPLIDSLALLNLAAGSDDGSMGDTSM